MTIAAAYLTSDGVVFGSDSTTTISSNQGVTQLFNYAQKIFEVGENSRLSVCTWGAGSLAGTSHRTLVACLADDVDLEKVSVCEAAKVFRRIVGQEYGDGSSTGVVGYLIGGWDPKTHLPECYQMIFQGKPEPDIVPFTVGQASFFGNPEFFSRVFHGWDNRLPGRILEELKKAGLGVDDIKLEQAFNEAFGKAVAPLQAGGFRDLPIREAIDFIHMYLHITIKAFKFRFGPPICGGPIEIAFISTDRKFRWALHKEFHRAIYEQEALHKWASLR